ncbi:prenylcysteine oxidase [Poronia punctata]|nr:prenylcysteine oxidase [Poronia punctata]
MLFQNLLSYLSFPALPRNGDVVSTDGVKQIAIIGAGAAGSSAAYHIQKYANESGIALNVTIFERTDHIGGRTLTVNVHDDPAEAIELGASIFVDVNYILSNATRDFGLGVKKPGGEGDGEGVLGIWDGDAFVYTQDSRSWNWLNLAKLFWKYGTAPYYTRKLVHDTLAVFLKLYDAPFFPFRSLSERAIELDLVKMTGVTGKQFLEANKLDGAFAHDIIQASTRVNYASNLDFIHGLGAMVAMSPEGAKSIEGGNWQIFANMLKASGADVHLNTAVTNIALGSDNKYKLTTSTSRKTHPVAFDDVIIATPFQYANISTSSTLLDTPIDEIPYATLHVTLFSSPHKFSPTFFKLSPGSEVPASVLTTLAADEAGQSGSGKAGFYSATLQRVVINPRTRAPEYVYKIFSPEAVTASFLSELLGVEVPETITPATSPEDNDNETSPADPVSWYHATVFHPYPQKQPRVTFQDPILRDGLYYTSGIESFISTMETSALMGMNVARLIVDSYATLNSNSTSEQVAETVPQAPEPEPEAEPKVEEQATSIPLVQQSEEVASSDEFVETVEEL